MAGQCYINKRNATGFVKRGHSLFSTVRTLVLKRGKCDQLKPFVTFNMHNTELKLSVRSANSYSTKYAGLYVRILLKNQAWLFKFQFETFWQIHGQLSKSPYT